MPRALERLLDPAVDLVVPVRRVGLVTDLEQDFVEFVARITLEPLVAETIELPAPQTRETLTGRPAYQRVNVAGREGGSNATCGFGSDK